MSYTEAAAEAYASADVSELTLDTLELYHPNFVDDNGNPTAVRIVRAFQNYNMTLENTAILNPGETVEFVACPFDFSLPKIGSDQVPQLQVAIDNVSREVTKYLELAISSLTPINVTYRPYIESDLTAPMMDPPIYFELSNVTADVFQVTGTCDQSDVYNWPFPYEKYVPSRFPGLVR